MEYKPQYIYSLHTSIYFSQLIIPHALEYSPLLCYSRPKLTCSTLGYTYIDDLIKLDQCKNQQPPPLPPVFFTNPSPLQWREWSKCLSPHPDPKFVYYITQGIKFGFRIGFTYHIHKCTSSTSNLISARQHPVVVRDYLLHECSQGRIIGPLNNSLRPFLQINRFGVIP